MSSKTELLLLREASKTLLGKVRKLLEQKDPTSDDLVLALVLSRCAFEVAVHGMAGLVADVLADDAEYEFGQHKAEAEDKVVAAWNELADAYNSRFGGERWPLT